MTHTLKTLLALPADELDIEIGKLQGYEFKDEGWRYPDAEEWQKYKAVYRGTSFIGLYKPKWTQIPYYSQFLNLTKKLEDEITDQLEKVNYINKLRQVIGTEKLKNSADCPIVSDFDLLTATAHHRAVAYVATKLKL